MQVWIAAAAACAALGCAEERARVHLAPVSPCGQVEDETALRVVAYTASGELRRTVPPSEIDEFPASTEQLAVEVVAPGGGLAAIGKTPPLAFAELPDGREVPVVMAPLDGFCPVGPMTEPRHAPAVARAGDLVLVVGGTGGDGEALATAEVYDPASATFSAVEVPSTLMDPVNGLAGAVLTELGDGRVALTGTSSHALALFDPALRRFSPPNLFDHRAFHGALVDGDRLLVIGGCFDVVDGACGGPTLRTGSFYALSDPSVRERGPSLDPSAVRHGARIFDLGEQLDGVARYVLAGGTGEPGAGDRFALADPVAQRVTGLAGELAALDGGALLTAFGAGGAVAAVLAPDAASAAPVANAPALTGARMVTLEDGSVLAIGDRVARYLPTTDTWRVEAPAGQVPPPLDAPALARLADGSVLVVGGGRTAEAWIYRPSLVGPRAGSVFALAGSAGDTVLTPLDPATVARGSDGLVLTAASDDLRARVLVGGPRMAEGSVTAVVRVSSGGVALVARQTGPGHALVGRLVPGGRARVELVAGGGARGSCEGAVVGDGALASTTVGLVVRGGVATLTLGAGEAPVVMARCEVPDGARGLWGIAAAGQGARVELGPVEVARPR